jgi:hypothetical protein
LKFDLSKANETNVAHARLRLTLSAIVNAPFTLSAWTVTDDAWSEESLTTSNAPPAVSVLGLAVLEHEPARKLQKQLPARAQGREVLKPPAHGVFNRIREVLLVAQALATKHLLELRPCDMVFCPVGGGRVFAVLAIGWYRPRLGVERARG